MPVRANEDLAVQEITSALATGLGRTAMEWQEPASRATARAIGTAALVSPIGRGGIAAGGCTKLQVAEAAHGVDRSCVKAMSMLKEPSDPARM